MTEPPDSILSRVSAAHRVVTQPLRTNFVAFFDITVNNIGGESQNVASIAGRAGPGEPNGTCGSFNRCR